MTRLAVAPLTIRPRRKALSLASGASAVLHLAGVALLLGVLGGPILDDMSRILPALYFYAPDRRPETPAELRIPIAAPLGDPLGSDRPVTAELPAGTVVVRPRKREGLPPAGPPAVRLDSVYTVLSVDSVVERDPWSASPAYPTSLLEAGIEGFVEAEYVVDSTGRVVPESARILFSTDQEFTGSVQRALTQMHFRPAWRQGQRVRQLVRQRFSFRIERQPDSVSM